jgi:hypothetical protein
MKFVTCSTLDKHGRLGNQLFQIACVIATGKLQNKIAIFPKWKYVDCFRKR